MRMQGVSPEESNWACIARVPWRHDAATVRRKRGRLRRCTKPLRGAPHVPCDRPLPARQFRRVAGRFGSTADLRQLNRDAVDLPFEANRRPPDIGRQWAPAISRPPQRRRKADTHLPKQRSRALPAADSRAERAPGTSQMIASCAINLARTSAAVGTLPCPTCLAAEIPAA
jgi:hypothetical protein